ncbi:MAG: hypothetical protein ACE5LU_06650 [Anaerolineae bacterium]
MLQPFERHTISFILRLWVEPMEPGEPQWRGQIEHVGSGEKTHFQVPPALLEFLVAHLPAPSAEAGAVAAVETKSEELGDETIA